MPILHTFARAETASRTHLLGASAAPVILGVSQWQTPFELWRSMQGAMADSDSNVKRRGRYLEAGLLQWTADTVGAVEVEGGIPIDEPGIAGPEAFMQFHPDGALRMSDGSWRLAEIKSSRKAAEWGDAGTDLIPLAYLAQVQYQLACCQSLQFAQVGAYLPLPDELRPYLVESDPAFQRFMVDRMGEWFYRHIVLGEAPQVDGSAASAEHLRRCFPQQLRPLWTADEGPTADLIRDYATTLADLKALEARKDLLGNQLRSTIGEAEGIRVAGVGKVTWRHTKGSDGIDLQRLRAEFPQVWAEVATSGESRRDLRFWKGK
jgi:predicted phage-related endonuclease